MRSLVTMVAYTQQHMPGIRLMFVQERGTILASMRSYLAEDAVKKGATHILWVDADMVFPADALIRLLKHKKPIVAANYSQRRAPCEPVAKQMDGKHWLYTDHMSTGLEAAIACGMGLMLTETGVFVGLPRPWFDCGEVDIVEKTGKPGLIGEDFWFCYAANAQLGVHPYIDHDLSKQVGHVGEYIYTFEDALRDRPQVRLIRDGILTRQEERIPEQVFADLVDLYKRYPAEELERKMEEYGKNMRAREDAEEAEWLAMLEG